MEEKDKKIIEHAFWALLLAWFSYMFLYQNYLLHNWHRGLPLPSKWPFVFLGVGIGTLFFMYKLRDIENVEESHIKPADTGISKESLHQSEDNF